MNDSGTSTSIASFLPKISVVIPARNEATHVGRCIDSIKRGTFPVQEFEIIVVDNDSTDQTASIASQHGATVLSVGNATVGALRNHGAKGARGELFAFIDADCEACPSWLTNAWESYVRSPSVTGSKCKIPDNPNWIESAWYPEPDVTSRNVRMINSGNLVVPAALFFAIGGFDPLLPSGEDSEFCERARKSAAIISDPAISVVHHGNPKTIRQFFARELWHGAGALGSFAQNPFDKPLIGTVVYSLSIMLFIAGVAGAMFGRELGIAGFVGFVVANSICLAAAKRGRKLPSLNLLSQRAILYHCYFAARALALAQRLFQYKHRVSGHRR